MGDTVSARANIASEAHSSMRRLINTELTSHALVAINYFGNYALANIQEWLVIWDTSTPELLTLPSHGCPKKCCWTALKSVRRIWRARGIRAHLLLPPFASKCLWVREGCRCRSGERTNERGQPWRVTRRFALGSLFTRDWSGGTHAHGTHSNLIRREPTAGCEIYPC